MYAFTHVYHQYVDRWGNRHIPLTAGFHDSQERHCEMCKQCDLSLPGDRMEPETTTPCHRSPIPGNTLSQWSLPDTPWHPLCGSRSSFLSSSKHSFNAVSGHIANERVGWKSLSGSGEPDIVKRHITDRSDRMNQRQNSERLKFMVKD